MKLITSIAETKTFISSLRKECKSIGFVPTMGALHQGHISLVEKCKAENALCVVSIFVNPTQFNDKNDLARYPRTLEKDATLLEEAGCDVIFAPSSEEMYKKEEIEQAFAFDFQGLDQVMEGKFRPNHFNGVVQIVSKLFDIVCPDKAYFGEKDFQQVAIIRLMTKTLNYPVNIISCPIIREKSGLAMSSRNELLSVNERKIAANISKVLFESRTFVSSKTVLEVQNQVIEKINAIDGLLVEYFDIVDGYHLQNVSNWTDSSYIVGCITVFCGKVRLIDNIQYK